MILSCTDSTKGVQLSPYHPGQSGKGDLRGYERRRELREELSKRKLEMRENKMMLRRLKLEEDKENGQVEDDIKAKVLQTHLNNKARTIVSRLNLTQLDDYQEMKLVLLQEFQVSPALLRGRFINRKRQPGETYSQVASDLHISLSYYVKSRNIGEDFHKLMSLLCADKLKELLPSRFADFILNQEKGERLDNGKLARMVDNYMAMIEKVNLDHLVTITILNLSIKKLCLPFQIEIISHLPTT